ncbi:unnamed protein product [Pylaiella littoralis]
MHEDAAILGHTRQSPRRSFQKKEKLIWWHMKMPSTPSARGSGSVSPETIPSGLRSRLTMPRDWRSSVNRRRKSEDLGASGHGSGYGSGYGSGSGRKEQQSPLEMDGEWFGDALDTPALSEKEPDQDSAAMSLLCSITQASADAVPEMRLPVFPFAGGSRHSRLRQQRSRNSSVNSYGCGESGEFYQLPWYRRPLPSKRRTSVASGEIEVKRANSMLVAPRSGLRPPRASTGGGAAWSTVAASGSSPAAAAEGMRFSGYQQEQEQAPVSDGGTAHGVPRSVAAAKSASETLLKTAPLSRPPSSVLSSSSADRGTTVQQAVPNTPPPPPPPAPKAAEMDATPAANSMAADRDAESRQVVMLRAEVLRLKREMASMAAAAAKATTPTHQKEVRSDRRLSQTMEVSSPSYSSRRGHPTWEGDRNPVGSEGSPDTGKGVHSKSGRLRADTSWMQRRRSSDDGCGGKQSLENSGGGGGSSSNGTGFGGRARAGSVLPAPGSDDTSRGGRKISDDGGHGLAEEEASLLSPPAHVRKDEGPSPASGKKDEEAKVVAAERRSSIIRTDSVEEAGGNDSGSSSNSMRQMSVFFPVKQCPQERTASRSEADSSGAAAAEGAAALASAAASHIGGTTSTSRAARAPQAARDAVSSRQQHAATRDVATTTEVYANASVSSAAAGAGAGGVAFRRRRAGNSNGEVWRWVLAQRMGTQPVRQALMKHGLPPFGRRHIWAAWAAVASPERCSNAKARPALAKEVSVMNVIMHDVARTKIVHPLFESGGNGLTMLKRVLLRCAELGAVKEAGYIQGMNYLAGFLLLTLADCIMNEREDTSRLSRRPTSREGSRGVGGESFTPPVVSATTASDTTREVILPPGLQLPPPAKVDVVAASKETSAAATSEEAGKGGNDDDATRKTPTEEEVRLIESECVQVMHGVIALQGGVLSRDLWGLHANTELVEDLLSEHCPDIMDHLKKVNLELIVLTPRWFICIYAGSMASQAMVTRIWDLFLWYGRRGPAVLVWVALGLLHGCRRCMFDSKSLPATVKVVRRHAEGCKSFDDLMRQAPISLSRVVASWEEQGNNRKIVALDGEGVVSNRMAAVLVGEMTGEPPAYIQPSPHEAFNTPKYHRRTPSAPGAPIATTSTSFGIQFPSTPGRSTTPLASPRSPFPEWAANIFRSSTGGGPASEMGEGSASAYADRRGEGGGGGDRGRGHRRQPSPHVSQIFDALVNEAPETFG